jgi:hypothetical protein
MSRSTRANVDRRRVRRNLIGAAAVVAVCSAATSAAAHGFGQRYDLPLPLSLYLFGTASAVVLSFVVAGLFMREPSQIRAYPRFNLLTLAVGRFVAAPAFGLLLQLVATGLFVLTVAAGFLGDQNPYRNLAPTLVWVVWWVGFTLISAFIGDLWPLINPWRTIFQWIEYAYRAAGFGEKPAGRMRYPDALDVWPAVALLFAFAWTELVFPNPAVPRNIAWFAVGYSIFTFAGMLMFGRETWLRHGELFTVFFGLVARFAATEVDCGARQWALRPFGAGLRAGAPASVSMVAFVLLVLSTVLYDGFLATPAWSDLERALTVLAPGLDWFRLIAVRTIGLAAFWGLFLGAYLAVSALMSVAARGQFSASDVARNFAFTLVPIAIGYHVAHYLVYLLIQGQYIIPLASDPFGFGWDLFETAAYRVDIALVGARFAWYAAVTAIVLGHIAAVYLAHAKAMELFVARGPALRTEVPLTALMVVYTFVSLSILAEPIVERRAPVEPTTTAAVAVPPDALLPEPGTGRLLPVGADKFAQVKLTYRLLGSAFHDGTRTAIADLLYAYMFVYRWSARTETENSHYDATIDAATDPMRRRLTGVRVVGTDTASKSFRVGDVDFVRELFIIDVYAAMPPEDAEQDAAVAPPWSTLPWHVIVLMEEAVARGWAAFSHEEALRRRVEWLDLVRSPAMNAKLISLVENFTRVGYRPDSLQSLVSIDDARKRWAALAGFYRTNGHFLVTNGPYRLKRWSADSASLVVFRDLSYPLGVGSFDAYAVPRRGFVTRIERENDRLRLTADIETVMKFQRSYRIVREPLASVAAEVRRRAAPECRYSVVDAEGRIAAVGSVPPADDWTFRVDLRGQVPAGRYTVLAEIIVNGNAANADIERIPIIVSSGP